MSCGRGGAEEKRERGMDREGRLLSDKEPRKGRPCQGRKGKIPAKKRNKRLAQSSISRKGQGRRKEWRFRGGVVVIETRWKGRETK